MLRHSTTAWFGSRCSRLLPQHEAATSAGVSAAARNGKFPSVKAARYSYTRAVHLGLIFFESMRSGTLDRQRLAWCVARCNWNVCFLKALAGSSAEQLCKCPGC